jgi:hypothetical protein
MDPRVQLSAAAVQSALQFSLENGAVLSGIWQHARELDSLRQAIDAQLQQLPKNSALRAPLQKLKARTDAWVSGDEEDGLNLNSVNESLADVLTDVGGTDRAPTNAQREVAANCARRAAAVASQWQALRDNELAALNKQLRQAGRTEITIPAPENLGPGLPEVSTELP